MKDAVINVLDEDDRVSEQRSLETIGVPGIICEGCNPAPTEPRDDAAEHGVPGLAKGTSAMDGAAKIVSGRLQGLQKS